MTTDAPTKPETTPTTLPPFSLELLPEPYKAEPVFKDFKSWEDVFKSHLSAAKLVGTDKSLVFKLPKEGELTPEIYKALGKPDKYEIPTQLQALTSTAPEYRNDLVKYADQANLTARQFTELATTMDSQITRDQGARKAAEENSRSAALAALRASQGEAYDQNINLAKDALETFKKPQLWDKLDKAGLTTDPDVISILSEIGKLTGEDKIVNGTGQASFKLTPAQARAEVNERLLDPAFSKRYFDNRQHGHKEAVDEIYKLRQIAFG